MRSLSICIEEDKSTYAYEVSSPNGGVKKDDDDAML